MIVQHFVDILLQDVDVAAIVANRVWPNEAIDAPGMPYVLVSRAGGQDEYDMEGPIGVERARVQVDVYGTGYAATVALAKLVKETLHARPPPIPSGASPCVIDSVMCITETDSPVGSPNASTARQGPRTKRRLLEFSVWFRS
jgi:hypothetical protein